MSTQIFAASGGAAWHNVGDDDDRYQYITLLAAGTGEGRDAAGMLNNMLTGRAPAGNVSIQDDIDFTLNKAFAGDMLVATFGHKPVHIQITGFDLYGPGCADESWISTRIHDFWMRFNVHDNNGARVTLSLSGADSVYMCILVGLRSDAASSAETPGIGSYALTLNGVPLWGGQA